MLQTLPPCDRRNSSSLFLVDVFQVSSDENMQLHHMALLIAFMTIRVNTITVVMVCFPLNSRLHDLCTHAIIIFCLGAVKTIDAPF